MKDTRGSIKFFKDQERIELASALDKDKFLTGKRKQAMATATDNITAK